VMVSYIEKEGYLRFTNVGWVDPHAILYHIVRFKNGVTGIVSKEDKKEIKDLKLKDLYIDIGACSKEEAESKVRIGDFAVFKSFFKLVGDRVYSGALDDRIGCYILIEAAKRLKDNKSDVYFTFTVQEETYTSGAATSAFAIEPDMAVVIDVTDTGDTPNCNAMAVKMGDGAAIKVKDGGMICHP
ncbi:MAG TPA: aminopeptidase, partial [Clostridiaceae bacterium]|nr:aminopeptidase [Clostridiaceae bacterium]